MDYDPIKDRLGALFQVSPLLQRLFYLLLDAVFLRAWYVRRAIRQTWPDRRAPLSILDAGTGFGQWVRFLAFRYPNARIQAVDVKQDYLDRADRYMRHAKPKAEIQFEYADLTRLADQDRYDLILSVDVMEHIEDDTGVFRNFYRALQPGGRVVINTPSNLGGSGVRREGDTGFIGEHVRDGYGAEELVGKLRDAGLEARWVEYTYGPVGSVAWRILIKWPMRLLHRSPFWMLALLIYYVPALPIGLLLNAIDLGLPNRHGTGLLVVAQKTEPKS